MTEQDEPEVGDFILLFDTESDESGEPPILLVRVTDEDFAGIGEGYVEQADQLEARARLLAHQEKTRAWRLVGESYVLLPPHESAKDVH